jgi:hypothetical protein
LEVYLLHQSLIPNTPLIHVAAWCNVPEDGVEGCTCPLLVAGAADGDCGVGVTFFFPGVADDGTGATLPGVFAYDRVTCFTSSSITSIKSIVAPLFDILRYEYRAMV